MFGAVNTAPGFTAQSLVMNGASDLMVEIFGEAALRHLLEQSPLPRLSLFYMR